jgi:hypothetical protein
MTTGSAMITCAVIMPAGVKSQPRPPSGPLRDKNKYTTSPTTTGGKPMPV